MNNAAKFAITAAEWRQIVDAAADTAIISLDAAGCVTSWNLGAAGILGWSEEDMLGERLDRLFTEEDRRRGRLGQEIADAASRGKGGGEEGWRLRKDGGRIWAAGEISAILDRSGGVIGYTKIIRDRTAQRQAEEEAAEERRALEILNRAGSALAAETDLQALVRIIVDAGVELAGAEFGAFFYNAIDEAGESRRLYTLSAAAAGTFPELPMPRNTELFAPTFNGEGILRSDDITRDPRYGRNPPHEGVPDGHPPVRSYLAAPVVSRGGEVIGGLIFGHQRAGVFTERAERGLRGLAAEAAVAIANVRLAQAAQREIDERRRAQEALAELNRTLERLVAERTEALRRNEEALRQSQKMEAIGQLTGGVAHDFNNLLQIIMGNLETVQRHLPAEAARLNRAAANAMTGARRAAALTQRLLAFSRRQPLNPRPLDPNALVRGMSELLNRTLGETILVETVLAAGVWRVEADATELEAAILNLAVNARDAMRGEGRLRIETGNAVLDDSYAASQPDAQAGRYVAISVSDTGVGMDAETMARAFEPFFTTKPVGKGTGLGLSQVYGFVKQSGGHVKIDSAPGQGTKVRLYLPRWAQGFAEEESPGREPAPESGGAETVLVVEDDESVRAHSVQSLQELGYRVIEANDGPSALRLMEDQPRIDLLFTDVVLPGGMTGAQLAAQARAMRPEMKVLFTTGYARDAIIHHGRLDKGVQLLTKPYGLADLAARVRDILDGVAR